MFMYSPDPFPIDRVPSLMRGAILEASALAGVQTPLAAGLAFAAAAVACQGHIKVRSPANLVSPLSMYFLHVAKSGDRKSTVEKLFLVGLREFQKFHDQRLQGASEQFDEALAVWQTEHSALAQCLSTAIRRERNTEVIKERLRCHEAQRPKAAKMPKLFFSETSPEALLHKLSNDWSSAMLQSSEASMLLAGRATRNLGALNVLWDGQDVEVDRRTGASFTVRDAKLSASLMVQPGVMQKFLAKGNGHARDVGFLARCLICAPESVQGTRFVSATDQHKTEFLNQFAHVTRALLGDYFSDAGVLCDAPQMLRFQPGAAEAWRRFYNYVEGALAPGARYSDIPDFASKIPENAVRLAAIFHAIEGKAGDLIDEATTESAVSVCSWYVEEFKRLLGEPQQLSEVHANAQMLEAWLQNLFVRCGSANYHISYSRIRTFGPNRLREKRALEDALDQLCRESKICIGMQNRQRFVVLNLQYFGMNYRTPQPPRIQSSASYV